MHKTIIDLVLHLRVLKYWLQKFTILFDSNAVSNERRIPSALWCLTTSLLILE